MPRYEVIVTILIDADTAEEAQLAAENAIVFELDHDGDPDFIVSGAIEV